MAEKICPEHGEPEVWWGNKRRCCRSANLRHSAIKMYLTKLHPSEWKRFGDSWAQPFIRSQMRYLYTLNPRTLEFDALTDIEEDEKANQFGYVPLARTFDGLDPILPKDLSMDHCLESPVRRRKAVKYVVPPNTKGFPDYMR